MPGEIVPAGSAPGPSALPALRASHADRDRVVAMLGVAAGDGRLTADELDQRVEAALSARTVGDLAALTADLPPISISTSGVPAESRDVLRIEQKFSRLERTGGWVLPRRLELAAEWCNVTLDFTQAVITQDTLEIDVDMQGGNLTLIVGPGITVDPYGLTLEFSKIKNQYAPDPGTPVRLRIELIGKKGFGRIRVRGPRRWGTRRS
ncbi:DUF1707 domain-containing protein [Streptomyces sp. CBMA123]|uniref:DUF1707 SHOCT-like domain-containing protein n=1 Tax=Streptomyces sp. CBMA123 TaxID=1896313 RepID=UPI0016621850|nr:DUF1707 domain-containing protein [Streptomyces sp. CBMA123]MBD0692946.1 hypothetical protein [Streptomyces sp. CBMA123]